MPRRAAFIPLPCCHGVQTDTSSVIAAQCVPIRDRGYLTEEPAPIPIRRLKRPGGRPPPGEKNRHSDNHNGSELPTGCGRLPAFEVSTLHRRPLMCEGPPDLPLLTGNQAVLRRNIARPSRANAAMHSHVPANTPSSCVRGPSPLSRTTYRRIAASVTAVSRGHTGRCLCVPPRNAI
jgi:hypothetical protein